MFKFNRELEIGGIVNEYVKEAVKTANKEAIDDSERYFKIYIFGELGELSGLIKKEHYHNIEISDEDYIGELGDILWGFAFNDVYSSVYLNWGIRDLEDSYGTTYNLEHMVEHLAGHDLDRTILNIIGFINYKGYDLVDIMEKNIQQLRRRYPDGYSHEACKERVDMIG